MMWTHIPQYLAIFVVLGTISNAARSQSRFVGTWEAIRQTERMSPNNFTWDLPGQFRMKYIVSNNGSAFHVVDAGSSVAVAPDAVRDGQSLVATRPADPGGGGPAVALRYVWTLAGDDHLIETMYDGPQLDRFLTSYEFRRIGGASAVVKDTGKKDLVRIVHSNGKLYLDDGNGHRAGPFDDLKPLGDGQYAAKSGGLWRVYDSSGHLASVFTWANIQPLTTGRYAGTNANGQVLVLDSTGHPASTFTYADIKSTSSGLVGKVNGKLRPIDRNGWPKSN